MEIDEPGRIGVVERAEESDDFAVDLCGDGVTEADEQRTVAGLQTFGQGVHRI
jgi:hypothetical protein